MFIFIIRYNDSCTKNIITINYFKFNLVQYDFIVVSCDHRPPSATVIR